MNTYNKNMQFILREMYRKRKMSYQEFNNRIHKYYSAEEREEFEAIRGQIRLEGRKGVRFEDFVLAYSIVDPKNIEYINSLDKKKASEIEQYMMLFGRDYNLNQLSYDDFIENYKPISDESNKQFDFISNDKTVLIEISQPTYDGALSKKLKKHHNTKDFVFHGHKASFEKAISIIEKKLSKSDSKHKCLIIIGVDAYHPSKAGIVDFMSAEAEWRNINKYINAIKAFSRNGVGVKEGKLVLTIGNLNSDLLVFDIKDNTINFNYQFLSNFAILVSELKMIDSDQTYVVEDSIGGRLTRRLVHKK